VPILLWVPGCSSPSAARGVRSHQPCPGWEQGPSPQAALSLCHGTAVTFPACRLQHRSHPSRTAVTQWSLAAMEESKLHFLPSHELAMRLPGPGSQLFTAGNVESRTAAWFFRYEVNVAAFVVIKLWLWLLLWANFIWESLRENKYEALRCHLPSLQARPWSRSPAARAGVLRFQCGCCLRVDCKLEGWILLLENA